jgi:uncharacterized protein YjbI with pentapeptide repeats
MALRILLVLAAFAVLYGCGQESSPVEKQEQAAGVERSAPAPASDQQAQDAALQTYLDQMSTLLLDEDLGDAKGMSLVGADLSGVDLTYSAPGDAQPYAAVPVLDLSRADLTYADLSGANLNGITMHGTRLVGADLRGAHLNGANLRHATGKTAEQLDGQASSLEGAIMPNGQKYEDWLKNKGRGENGENSGT